MDVERLFARPLDAGKDSVVGFGEWVCIDTLVVAYGEPFGTILFIGDHVEVCSVGEVTDVAFSVVLVNVGGGDGEFCIGRDFI